LCGETWCVHCAEPVKPCKRPNEKADSRDREQP
jgi:hypothetical protein